MEQFVTTIRDIVEYCDQLEPDLRFDTLRSRMFEGQKIATRYFNQGLEAAEAERYQSFKDGVAMCAVDGAGEDGIVMLWEQYMTYTLHEGLAMWFVSAAHYMLKGLDGSLHNYAYLGTKPFNMAIPGIDKDEDQDILLDLDICEVVDNLAGDVSFLKNKSTYRESLLSLDATTSFYMVQQPHIGLSYMIMAAKVAKACDIDLQEVVNYWLVEHAHHQPK